MLPLAVALIERHLRAGDLHVARQLVRLKKTGSPRSDGPSTSLRKLWPRLLVPKVNLFGSVSEWPTTRQGAPWSGYSPEVAFWPASGGVACVCCLLVSVSRIAGGVISFALRHGC